MKVAMKNPRSGELVDVKVGFDLVLFLTTWFFGFSLFLRKLNVWGAFMFAILFAGAVMPTKPTDPNEQLGQLITGLAIYLGLSLFFGIKGNELTAKNYLDLGWQFVNPESDEAKAARLAWGLKS